MLKRLWFVSECCKPTLRCQALVLIN
jgi:hypothetical protein